MLCVPCGKNGIQRTGGDFGLCWQHKKTKCRAYGCGQLSAGKLYCTKCEHEADIERIKARSTQIVFDENHEFFEAKIRKERLWESRKYFFTAFETIFQGLLLIADALFGALDSEGKVHPKIPEDKPDFKEAA